MCPISGGRWDVGGYNSFCEALRVVAGAYRGLCVSTGGVSTLLGLNHRIALNSLFEHKRRRSSSV